MLRDWIGFEAEPSEPAYCFMSDGLVDMILGPGRDSTVEEGGVGGYRGKEGWDTVGTRVMYSPGDSEMCSWRWNISIGKAGGEEPFL